MPYPPYPLNRPHHLVPPLTTQMVPIYICLRVHAERWRVRLREDFMPLDNLPTLQNLFSEVLIYLEDILGPASSLKYLSALVVLQSLLNLQARQDYLSNSFPF